ncbi:MAG: hypothetical protein QM784_20775 [Polyangiaceae bacterium]
MIRNHFWQSARAAPLTVKLGLFAFISCVARTACFSVFGIGWITEALVIAVVAYGGTRHRVTARLAVGLFAIIITWTLGSFTCKLYRFGAVLVCPSGSSRTASDGIAGEWVSCLRRDGTPLGPAIGTSYGGDGSTTVVYEDYRMRNGKIVGLRVSCGSMPIEPFEVCFPEAHGQRCEPARFEPPLPWKGCSNLRAQLAEGFARNCRTRTVPSELCF